MVCGSSRGHIPLRDRRRWLVVEGAVEAFGNGYVGTGVDTAFHF